MASQEQEQQKNTGSTIVQDPAIQKLLQDQQEANAKLILVVIQAHELADEATAAHALAEAVAKELRDNTRKLQEALAHQEEILGIVGHDLRNPLAAIHLSAVGLMRRGNLNEADARSVARMIRSGQRMDRMILQILDLTRIRIGGGMLLNRKQISLREVCQQVIGELDLRSESPVHWEAEGDLTGTWDVDRLMQVLSNLVGNALEHATQGTPVLVRASESRDVVMVEVSNHGPPLPEDLLPIIFDAFRRTKGAVISKAGNLGLGLYIAHQIALAHGGSLEAQSIDGMTTFSLRLPRHPAAS